jgi:hypothetical protein
MAKKKSKVAVPDNWPEGLKISAVRMMTAAEADAQGWVMQRHGWPLVFEIEGGGTIFAARDYEGNGAGALFAVDPAGQMIILLPDVREPIPQG